MKQKKMKIIIIIIFLFFMNNKSYYCLELKSICKINENKICKGQYDDFNNYMTTCETIKCGLKKKYQCTNDYCAGKEQSCELFKKFLLFNTFHGKRIALDKYVSGCESIRYTFKTQHVCLNGQNCYSYSSNNQKIKINCQCKGKYNYKCGNFYCSIHNLACQGLNKTVSTITPYHHNKVMFQQCGNNHRFINLMRLHTFLF